MEVGLNPDDFVLDEDPTPLPKKGRSPQFLAHIYCDQRAAWIKMPLGTEVVLGLRDIVLDDDPALRALPPLKGHSPQFFSLRPLCPNGWMDEDATCYGSIPRPRPHCIKRGPSSPRKGHSSPPLFCPCLLWPRSPISATAALVHIFRHTDKMAEPE